MSYIFKRLLTTCLILFGVIFATFILMKAAPGDPVQNFIGQRADPETIARIEKEWGLDQPFGHQFFKYVGRVLDGDLGKSYFTQEDVLKSFFERFPTTFLLASLAVLIGALIGISTGILSAAHPHTFLDKGLMLLTLMGISLPVFWAGVLLLIFATQLDTLPLIRQLDPLFFNILLASIVLGIRPAALVSRITREQMANELKEDYILGAWARSVPAWRIYVSHALRNALGPILTALALDFGSLLSGAAITETIFGIPGIGKYGLAGLAKRDYPVILGMVLICALIFVLTNLFVDLIVPLFNPKMRERATQP